MVSAASATGGLPSRPDSGVCWPSAPMIGQTRTGYDVKGPNGGVCNHHVTASGFAALNIASPQCPRPASSASFLPPQIAIQETILTLRGITVAMLPLRRAALRASPPALLAATSRLPTARFYHEKDKCLRIVLLAPLGQANTSH